MKPDDHTWWPALRRELDRLIAKGQRGPSDALQILELQRPTVMALARDRCGPDLLSVVTDYMKEKCPDPGE